MKIKKLENACLIELENSTKIYLDPQRVVEGSVNIVTEPAQNVHHDTNFNLPGEYELKGISIYGYSGKTYSFVISNDINILYTQGDLPEKMAQKIQDQFGAIDVIIMKNSKDLSDLKNRFKTKVFVTLDKAVQVAGCEIQKGKEISLKKNKLEPICHFLQG